MVTVKLFGALRLRSGLKEYQLEAQHLNELYDQLVQISKQNSPEPVSIRDLKSCIVMINGTQCKPRHSLKDGDTVVLLTPASGG